MMTEQRFRTMRIVLSALMLLLAAAAPLGNSQQTAATTQSTCPRPCA